MIIFNVHFLWSFLMFIFNVNFYDHFLWSLFMIIFNVHFFRSFIRLSLRLPYSDCGRVCVWWGVKGKALILRNKRKDKITQGKRWQDKTEQGTRRLDRSAHDQNVPCFMSLWCMACSTHTSVARDKSQEFKGRRLAKGTRSEKIRPDKKRQGITRQEKTRHNKTGQEKTTTREDKTRQDKTRQDKVRQGKARQDKARQGKAS